VFIKFDEYDLLELFEKEPTLIAEKEAGLFIYSKIDNHGFKLLLNLSIYENQCNISLDYHEMVIFDIKLQEVESIKSDGSQLRIKRENIDRDVVVEFKPHFSLKIDNI
jgi:hypothetical protein